MLVSKRKLKLSDFKTLSEVVRLKNYAFIP